MSACAVPNSNAKSREYDSYHSRFDHVGAEGPVSEDPALAPYRARILPRAREGKRIAVVEGDMFEDPLPDGHDLLIVANTVHVVPSA